MSRVNDVLSLKDSELEADEDLMDVKELVDELLRRLVEDFVSDGDNESVGGAETVDERECVRAERDCVMDLVRSLSDATTLADTRYVKVYRVTDTLDVSVRDTSPDCTAERERSRVAEAEMFAEGNVRDMETRVGDMDDREGDGTDAVLLCESVVS